MLTLSCEETGHWPVKELPSIFMYFQHRKFSELKKPGHWECVGLWMDNYKWVSSFNTSFMLLFTAVSLLIFSLKTGISPFLGATEKWGISSMADDEWKKKRIWNGTEGWNDHTCRKTGGHWVEDHNCSPSSLKVQGISVCCLRLCCLLLWQDEGKKWFL